jgi:hypothetical protein
MSIKSMGIKMTIYDVIKIDLITKIILYENSNFWQILLQNQNKVSQVKI